MNGDRCGVHPACNHPHYGALPIGGEAESGPGWKHPRLASVGALATGAAHLSLFEIVKIYSEGPIPQLYGNPPPEQKSPFGLSLGHVVRVGVQMSTTTQDDNSLRAMKARQTRKIQQLREVFLTNGRLSVRKQAELLGLRPAPRMPSSSATTKVLGSPQRSSNACWRARTYPKERGLSYSNTTLKRLPVYTAILVPKDVDLWPRSQRKH